VDGTAGVLGALEGAGEDAEVVRLVHEGAGDVGVDAFGRVGGGEFGDLEIEESGFEGVQRLRRSWRAARVWMRESSKGLRGWRAPVMAGKAS